MTQLALIGFKTLLDNPHFKRAIVNLQHKKEWFGKRKKKRKSVIMTEDCEYFNEERKSWDEVIIDNCYRVVRNNKQ